jgi:hypothetical protein
MAGYGGGEMGVENVDVDVSTIPAATQRSSDKLKKHGAIGLNTISLGRMGRDLSPTLEKYL